MNRLRILLADDHAVVRQGLRLLVHEQPDMEVVAEAASGEEAWQQAMETRPDVVVMDISMPGWDGARATKHLTEACPGVRVLALTFYEDEVYLRRLLDAGAAGYVVKGAAAEELTTAIRTVAEGGVYVDARMARALTGLAPADAVGNRAAPDGELNDRERDVIRLIAWGYSNREIADRLQLAVDLVAADKCRAMAKLGLRGRVDLVRYASGKGWIQES